MGPLELLGLGYTIFAVLSFTFIMLVLAWFGFKSLIGTISVRVTEESDKKVDERNQIIKEFLDTPVSGFKPKYSIMNDSE